MAPNTDAEKLYTIDARVKILEEALAKFLHATAASIPMPPTRSARKRDRADAAPLSLPAPTNTDGETLPDVPPATEAAHQWRIHSGPNSLYSHTARTLVQTLR